MVRSYMTATRRSVPSTWVALMAGVHGRHVWMTGAPVDSESVAQLSSAGRVSTDSGMDCDAVSTWSAASGAGDSACLLEDAEVSVGNPAWKEEKEDKAGDVFARARTVLGREEPCNSSNSLGLTCSGPKSSTSFQTNSLRRRTDNRS